jgi:chorismate synthase
MSGNTFGKHFTLTTFGESHGPGLGGVVDGCPAGIPLTEAMIQEELDRRRPGQGPTSTARREKDRVRLLSGVLEGVTTGTSIGFFIANEDQHSKDYDRLKSVYRPGHGDITYQAKYGVRDHRGGGRSSGRETASRVAGGAVAAELLRSRGIEVTAYTVEIGAIPCPCTSVETAGETPFNAADPTIVPVWEERVRQVRSDGDTLGGVVEVLATGVPAGLGEPVMDKLDARLAYALMGIGAVKGVEIGAGFEAARMLGSQNNDPITPEGFASNNAGGILAGISNGDAVVARVGVKPIPSIATEQQTVDAGGNPTTIRVGGRHDICAIPRIVPVVRAMVCLVLADMVLLQEAGRR